MLNIEKIQMPAWVQRGRDTTIVSADGIGDMLKWARTHGEQLGRRLASAESAHWSNGDTYEKSLDMIEGRAEPNGLKEMAAMLASIDASFEDRTTSVFIPSVAGAYPIVPEFLSGAPDCMRQRTVVASELAPIRIFVSVYISGSISAGKIISRGAACASLAAKLGETRPVELWVYDEWGDGQARGFQMRFRLNTAQVSASEVAAAICTASCIRNIWYPAQSGFMTNSQAYIHSLPPPWSSSRKEWEKASRYALGALPNDVVVGAVYGESDQILNDPIAWVHDQIATQRDMVE